MTQQQIPVMQQVQKPDQYGQRRQQVPEYGGGGGGGGQRGGGPQGFEPKELAYLFRQLADASGRLFTAQTRFLITEQSAHELLTGSFEALATATEQGRLPEIVRRMRESAEEQRVYATRRMAPADISRRDLPIFSESEGGDIVRKIRDCLLPAVPK